MVRVHTNIAEARPGTIDTAVNQVQHQPPTIIGGTKEPEVGTTADAGIDLCSTDSEGPQSLEDSPRESGASDGGNVGRGGEADSNVNGRRGASEDDEEGTESNSGREDEALRYMFEENRRIYNRTKAWPKNDMPAITLTVFQELRRHHFESQVKQEGDRYEVKGPTHLTRVLNQLQHGEERERATFVWSVQECLENQYKRVRGYTNLVGNTHTTTISAIGTQQDEGT